MAIAVINSWIANGTTGDATINVTDVLAGDLLVSWFNIHAPSASPTCNPPSGWLPALDDKATGAYLFKTDYKFWSTGDTSYVFDMVNTDYWAGGVIQVRGVDTTIPIGLTTSLYGSGTPDGNHMLTTPTATLSTNCLIIALFASIAATARTFSSATMTEIFDLNKNTGCAAYYVSQAAIDTITALTADISGTAIVWCSRQVVLNPIKAARTWKYLGGTAKPQYVGVPAYIYDRPHPYLLEDMNVADINSEISRTECHGQSIRFTWANREATSGVRIWSDIDTFLTNLAANYPGKKAMIRVSAGGLSPAWLRDDSGALTVTNDGVKTLVPWGIPGTETIYLTNWLAFIVAFGAKYNGNPLIECIHMSGGGKAGEMSLGANWPVAESGFTPQICIDTWKTIIDAYYVAFPDTPCCLNIMEPIAGSVYIGTVTPFVVAYGLATYGNWFKIQNNGLNDSEPWGRDILKASSFTHPFRYQMTGSDNYGNPPGDREDAFQMALDDKARTVEVYWEDYEDPTYTDAIRFLAGV
jgi:hypothetical protein